MIVLRNVSLGFTAGVIGGLGWFLGVWIAIKVGIIPPQMEAALLGKATLYKQLVWGGAWGILLAVPVLNGLWWLKGFIVGCLATAAAVFYFGAHLQWPAERIAMGVVLNGVFWGFAAGFWYWLVARDGGRR